MALMRLARPLLLLCAVAVLVSACAEEEEFPNHIPNVKASVGIFQQAIALRNPQFLDSVCTDRELYGDLINVLGDDSMAVLGRQIRNPIDSAHVLMTVAPIAPEDSLPGPNYSLELFLRRQGETYWIVAHRLRPSPQ